MSGKTTPIVALTLLVLGVAAAIVLPVPGPAELRAWASGAGPGTALLFLLTYAVVTIAPIPRTVFNLAAGLLLGDVGGVLVAIVATTIAAGCAFGLARLLGSDLMSRHSHRMSVRTVNERLSGGGSVLTIMSLRLIPVIPFAPLSYCCGVSAVRWRPYLVGTALGSLPGTAAVVVLGDALTGRPPPALLACYAVFASLGVAGMIAVSRKRASIATEPEYAATTPSG